MGQNPNSNHFLRFKMRDAAKDDRLIICKCTSCRRTVVFLAKDLVEIKGGSWDPHEVRAPRRSSRQARKNSSGPR